MLLTSGVAAPVLFLLGRSAVLGALSLVLALSLAALPLLGGAVSPPAGVLIGTAVLTALILEGIYYAPLPSIAALFLAAAPAGVWIMRSVPMRPRSALVKAVVLILVFFICVAIAFVVAWLRGPPRLARSFESQVHDRFARIP